MANSRYSTPNPNIGDLWSPLRSDHFSKPSSVLDDGFNGVLLRTPVTPERPLTPAQFQAEIENIEKFDDADAIGGRPFDSLDEPPSRQPVINTAERPRFARQDPFKSPKQIPVKRVPFQLRDSPPPGEHLFHRESSDTRGPQPPYVRISRCTRSPQHNDGGEPNLNTIPLPFRSGKSPRQNRHITSNATVRTSPRRFHQCVVDNPVFSDSDEPENSDRNIMNNGAVWAYSLMSSPGRCQGNDAPQQSPQYGQGNGQGHNHDETSGH